MLIGVCHKCDRRSCGGKDKHGCAGVMLCTVSGRNIIDHATTGDCPLGKFTQPTATATPQPRLPLPRDKWPVWALAVAALAKPGDVGVGSTVERLLGQFGTAYKATLRLMGVPCGCAARKVAWDASYAYTTSDPVQ